MTTADDLRDLRDALDSIAHGALPRWGTPTTKTGEESIRAAKAMYARYVCALLAESGGKAAMDQAKKHEDNHRTHAEILTDYNEKLEQERDEARAQRDNLLDASKEGAWMARALDAERHRDVLKDQLKYAESYMERQLLAVKQECSELKRLLAHAESLRLLKKEESNE